MSYCSNTRKSFSRCICIGLILVMTLFAVGCYGHFPLTRAVYRTNANIGSSVGSDSTANKVAQTVVMWVLIIIPVYEVAMIGDVIVLNLIEFWTGDTVRIGSVEEEHDGVRIALEPMDGENAARLVISRDGEVLTDQRLTQVSPDQFEMRDTQGALTGMIHRTECGDIELADAEGKIIRTLAAADIEAIQ